MCESINRYSKEGYRNWLGCLNGLRVLRCRLQNFLEDKTQEFHRTLVDQFGTDECTSNCEIKANPRPQQLPDVCVDVCKKWSERLLAKHSAKGSLIHWINCNPQRWTQDKWEVAKVYMPGGHRHHIKFDDFDIAALINLMRNCSYIHQFIRAKKVQQILNSVTEVRNQLMHSPDYTMSQTERDQHLDKIRLLGKVLTAHAPEMISLSEEIDKGIQEQSPEEMRKMEVSVISEGIGYIMVSLSQSSNGPSEEEPQGLIEAADRMLEFVQHDRDLHKPVSMQMAHMLYLRNKTESLKTALQQAEDKQQELDQKQLLVEQQQQECDRLFQQSRRLSVFTLTLAFFCVLYFMLQEVIVSV